MRPHKRAWRCPHNDLNPSPLPSALYMLEPNDGPSRAVGLSTSRCLTETRLRPTLVRPTICPDRSDPTQPQAPCQQGPHRFGADGSADRLHRQARLPAVVHPLVVRGVPSGLVEPAFEAAMDRYRIKGCDWPRSHLSGLTMTPYQPEQMFGALAYALA